ncbi:hypothetical protein TNCV_4351831 [Trichonephila clavipes]|nr:hypothetical protein TNCV_4351831 [Trichonephila clavipes]
MDEILTTARDVELEVNEDDIEELMMGHEDDIEELMMGHEDELTTEELQEILNEEHQKNTTKCVSNKRKTKEEQCRHLPLKIF